MVGATVRAATLPPSHNKPSVQSDVIMHYWRRTAAEFSRSPGATGQASRAAVEFPPDSLLDSGQVAKEESMVVEASGSSRTLERFPCHSTGHDPHERFERLRIHAIEPRVINECTGQPFVFTTRHPEQAFEGARDAPGHVMRCVQLPVEPVRHGRDERLADQSPRRERELEPLV